MFRSSRCFCWLCVALGAALALVLVFAAPRHAAAQPPKPVSFINDVAPILKESCFGCHGAKNPKGKFDMTRYESFRRGGTKDDPVAEGKPDESYLITVLTAPHTSKMRMPPPLSTRHAARKPNRRQRASRTCREIQHPLLESATVLAELRVPSLAQRLHYAPS